MRKISLKEFRMSHIKLKISGKTFCELAANEFQRKRNDRDLLGRSKVNTLGKMIISLSLNITMNQVGGASVIAKFHS